MQRLLGKVVVPVRSVRRVFAWDDPYITTHVSLCLLFLTLVLVVIPWGPVLHWGARLVGILLFGPHMFFVGKLVDKWAAEEKAKEVRYQEGNGETRRKMLAELREEKEKELAELVKNATATDRTEQQKKATEFLEANRNNLAVRPTRLTGRFRFRSTPILDRSCAIESPRVPWYETAPTEGEAPTIASLAECGMAE